MTATINYRSGFSLISFLLFLLSITVCSFSGKKNSAKKFTIILVPDTQYYTEVTENGGSSKTGGTTAMLTAQTNWIATQRKELNIVYTGQLGDCVQNGDNPPAVQKNAEWKKMSIAFATLEDSKKTGLPQGIPFGLSVGNHDQTPVGDPAGTTNLYNQYFGVAHFQNKRYYGGHSGSNNDNHFQLFSAGELDFLALSLEYDQTPAFTKAGGALDWAESVIKKHPTRKVIVMTHYGINEAVQVPAFSPQGQAIYERLKQYPNFILFVCGHICHQDGEARRTDYYKNNTVHTLLSDYQCRPGGGNGLLRILEFDPAANKVAVKTYSPFTDSYETDEDSQFSLDVNLNN